MTVYDVITREPFEDADIRSRIGELRKRSLVDSSECAVVPVSHSSKPHYRRLVATDMLLGGRESTDRDSHDNCRNWLLQQLSLSTSLKVVTHSFKAGDDEEGSADTFTKPVLAEVGANVSYDWFGEARIGVDVDRYIQPDIAGRNKGAFSARPSQPSVVIEVVRTHTPEPETLIELLRLSCNGHLVVFYFIGKQLLDKNGKPIVYQGSKYNSIAGSSGLELRVSYYLYGGEGYRNGKVFERRGGEPLEKYASYLSGLLQAASRRV